MTVKINFIQWIGQNSALPPAYTDTILNDIANNETALHDFLQIITQRLALLWYHSWIKLHPCCDYWMKDAVLKNWINSFPGCDDLDLQPLLTNQILTPFFLHKNTKMLEKIIQSYWKIPCFIQENTGAWLSLPETNLNFIATSGKNNQLGKTLFLGKKRFQRNAGITIKILELTLEQYQDFKKPSSKSLFQKLVDFFLEKRIAFTLRTSVFSSEYKVAQLGRWKLISSSVSSA